MCKSTGILSALLFCSLAFAAEPALKLSVYSTAGDVNRYLATQQGREQAEAVFRRLHITKIFLEGRRGDEYVTPEVLRTARDYFKSRGFEVSGGIATVPGKTFGARQDSRGGWLNWESDKTRQEIADFFRVNAGIFDEIIIDDFYCTNDTSEMSIKARGHRSWSQYRRDLMVSLIEPLVLKPALEVNPSVHIILKYPQWYDRFQLFGYDPARMSPFFDNIWVGTESRNPLTQRFGYVQPYEGYVNFRWLSDVSGPKTEGAWFDHIECTAQNFIDQAYQSVLAGAPVLTLFHLGDVLDGNPGHKLLINDWPELTDLAARIKGQTPVGLAYYKPSSSAPGENLYLMDYLGMIGLPVVPRAEYPGESRLAMLGVQAAADPYLLHKMRLHLASGATIVVTPGFLEKMGASVQEMAGVKITGQLQAATTSEVQIGRKKVALSTPLELDGGLQTTSGTGHITAQLNGARVPLLVSRRIGGGEILTWNIRSFSQQDFEGTDELLLAPRPRGIEQIPRELADQLRSYLLAPLGIRLSAPTRVGFYKFGGTSCFYNFRDENVNVNLNGSALEIGANRLLCR